MFKSICTFYYYHFTLVNIADAWGYFHYAQALGFVPSIGALFQTGTEFLENVSALFFPLISIFENQYLMLYIPFSLLGFIGALLFYRTFRIVAPLKHRVELYLLCFFMPNLVFWTSNLGKDSFSYFAIALVMYGFVARPKPPRNIMFIGFGSLLLYLVRPHILLFLICGFLLGLFFERRKLSIRSVVVFAVMLIAFLILHNRILQFAGVEVDSDETKQTSISSYYSAGVSRVESSSQGMNIGDAATGRSHGFSIFLFPYYLFTFLTVPYLWQARKVIHFVSAFETIIYQIMIVYVCIHWKDVTKIKSIPFKYSWLIYLLVSSIIGGAAQTNFGLVVRERCMVLPVILLVFACVRYQLASNKLLLKKPPPVGGINAKVVFGPTPPNLPRPQPWAHRR